MIDLLPRQQQILELIARGLFLKLGVHCRAGAVATKARWHPDCCVSNTNMMISAQRFVAGLVGAAAFAATVASVVHVHADPHHWALAALARTAIWLAVLIASHHKALKIPLPRGGTARSAGSRPAMRALKAGAGGEAHNSSGGTEALACTGALHVE